MTYKLCVAFSALEVSLISYSKTLNLQKCG